jgi:hypothetical protein
MESAGARHGSEGVKRGKRMREEFERELDEWYQSQEYQEIVKRLKREEEEKKESEKKLNKEKEEQENT